MGLSAAAQCRLGGQDIDAGNKLALYHQEHGQEHRALVEMERKQGSKEARNESVKKRSACLPSFETASSHFYYIAMVAVKASISIMKVNVYIIHLASHLSALSSVIVTHSPYHTRISFPKHIAIPFPYHSPVHPVPIASIYPSIYPLP